MRPLPEHCITCSDEAVPARVVTVQDGTAIVDVGGRRERVAVELVDAVVVGDVLLCHAGIALARLEPA